MHHFLLTSCEQQLTGEGYLDANMSHFLWKMKNGLERRAKNSRESFPGRLKGPTQGTGYTHQVGF